MRVQCAFQSKPDLQKIERGGPEIRGKFPESDVHLPKIPDFFLWPGSDNTKFDHMHNPRRTSLRDSSHPVFDTLKSKLITAADNEENSYVPLDLFRVRLCGETQVP